MQKDMSKIMYKWLQKTEDYEQCTLSVHSLLFQRKAVTRWLSIN